MRLLLDYKTTKNIIIGPMFVVFFISNFIIIITDYTSIVFNE